MVSAHLRSIRRVTHRVIHAPSPKVQDMRGCIGENPSPISAKDSAKIEYISGDNPHPMS